MTTIRRDDEIRSGDPRIEGTRITVFDVKRRVVDGEEDPHVVAGEYDLHVADVYAALAYYYDHRADLADREREMAATRRAGERRTNALVEDAERNGPAERAD